ncbi:MAG TPA: alpha/beta hydrolase [Rhizomicrobium sp.]|jgi:valacyclovir hydrolase|nr:alpha/beta hydrolase [Rhizomicrobium sp.]
MPRIAIPGLSMHFERAGQGAPLLLIPGALGTGAGDFPGQIGWFAERGFEVVAPDPRGYGQSRPPERDYPLDFYDRDAADMFALMAALGHERFAILGWSDGANIAAIMAAQKPHALAKLVMFGGQSFLTAEEIAAFNGLRDISAWSPQVVEVLRAVYGDGLDNLWDRYVDGQEALFQAGGNLYRERLARVQCPAFVLHGARDPLVPAFHAEAIHRGIAGSRLHIFPEGKHNIHTRYAGEFNALVHAFLTEGI